MRDMVVLMFSMQLYVAYFDAVTIEIFVEWV